MARSTHHLDYQTLLTFLRDLRQRADVTQAALAERIGNTQTFVSKIERGERRLDIVEFVEWCAALGIDPIAAFQDYIRRCPTRRRTAGKLAARK